MKANKTVFAKNLRRLRGIQDKTQLEIAIELGIDEHRVSQWEAGICFPKMGMLIQVVTAYGFTDIYKLLTEEIPISTQ
jgi:transcriptional regulator with XRE-family HTH domain